MKQLFFFIILALATPAIADNFPAGASYEYAFSPRAGSLDLVLRAIDSADKQILVAAYTFTSKPVSLALLEAHKRGVDVRLVVDEKSNRRYTAAHFLANQGVPVRLNGNYPIMHNKFMVVDGETVETGSFNFSAAAANKNAENVLVIWYAPELAQEYTKEWQRLWDESAELKATY